MIASDQVRGRVVRRLLPGAAWAVLACLPAIGVAQSRPDFTGAWVLDAAGHGSRDVYGELRVIRQTNDAVHVTMVDYGSAWIEGSFRGVVRLVPWTFPFGWWAPRRGTEESEQPLAHARRTGDRLVLAKATAHGNGDFVWVWSLSGDGAALLQQETDQRWDADFDARPPAGVRTSFQRASLEDTVSSASIRARLARLARTMPVAAEITVRVAGDLTTLLVSCPRQECRIVEMDSGVQVGSRVLARGTVGVIPVHREARIEPQPAPGRRSDASPAAATPTLHRMQNAGLTAHAVRQASRY